MPAQTCTNYACNLQVYVLKDQEAFQEIYKLLPEKYFNILSSSRVQQLSQTQVANMKDG